MNDFLLALLVTSPAWGLALILLPSTIKELREP
ncbi:hypothetical protein NYA28ABAC_00869 [Salinicola sp. NYA28a]|jgi:hypothetical protein